MGNYCFRKDDEPEYRELRDDFVKYIGRMRITVPEHIENPQLWAAAMMNTIRNNNGEGVAVNYKDNTITWLSSPLQFQGEVFKVKFKTVDAYESIFTDVILLELIKN